MYLFIYLLIYFCTCNLFCVAVTKDSKVATIIALPTGIRVAKTAMQRNVPNYLFQVEYAGKYHGVFLPLLFNMAK